MIWASTCIGLLVALAFIGVGATVVRKARPTSGYLLIAAGVLELGIRCCRFGAQPERAVRWIDHDVLRMVVGAVAILGALEWLLVGVLVAVALVGLARDLRATAPQG